MAQTVYIKRRLTGGQSSDVDGIDGDNITKGDVVFLLQGGSTAKDFHVFYATTEAFAESSPDIIVPDSNPGSFNWRLYGKNYVQRKSSAWDYNPSDFQTDNDWHALDVSGKIPSGAKAVSIAGSFLTSDANQTLNICRKLSGSSTTHTNDQVHTYTQVASIYNSFSGVIGITTDRNILYKMAGGASKSSAYLTLKGWFY